MKRSESVNQDPSDGKGDYWIFYDPWPLESDASRSSFTAANVSCLSAFHGQSHQSYRGRLWHQCRAACSIQAGEDERMTTLILLGH